MKRILLLAAAMFAGTSLVAQERIKSYDIQVDIRADGSLDVTERIAVVAEGTQIRRGIYRDFPTRYRDRAGNQVKVDLEVQGVERNNTQEPWFTERRSNGIRINTGNDDFLTVPADYVYTFRYRTTRQLGFFKGNDELYWNAIGTSWIFPIESASVEVRLPEQVPVDRMSAEGYTGGQGARGGAYEASIPAPGMARYRITQALAPYEGFTIVLTFPKGIVAEPTSSERTGLFFRDNRGVFVAVAGFVLVMFYMLRQWRAVGRDPAKGIVIARYEPREGQTPAGLRYVLKMGYDMRCFTADVLALAIGGHLRIDREEKLFKDAWSLERGENKSAAGATPAQRTLLSGLFPGGSERLELKNSNAGVISAAREAHSNVLGAEANPKYFRLNGAKVGIAVVIAVVSFGGSALLSGGYGIPAILVLGGLTLLSIVVFAFLIRAPTAEGRALLDEIEGLKLYMSVAERDELASMRGPDEPPLDAKRYEAMLPYAVALDVEDAWTNKFTEAAGAAAAAAAASNMVWYSGRGPITNLGDFSQAVGSSLSSTISSASSPPGSGSGSGGGGSSGGGGGGGGGGGR